MPDLSASDKQKILKSLPKIAGALGELFPTINPLLGGKTEIAKLHNWVEAFVILVVTDPFDQTRAIDLGMGLEMLDSFQPVDLLRVQHILQLTLLRDLSKEAQLKVYPTLVPVFIAVVSGFYIGKARRAAAINMSAASHMGHELKTPINAITGFSQVILKEIDGPITEFQKEDLTSIHQAGKKLLTMINDLAAVMKQDASRFGLYPSTFSVSDLLAEVMANIYPICASEGHTLTFKLECDLGTIQGDASKIQWILLCLLLYLSHQGTLWQISLRAIRRVISEQTMLVFHIDGQAEDTILSSDEEIAHTASIDFINRDVGLAICWRFCTDIGASIVMSEGRVVSFELQIPAIYSSSSTA